MATKTLNTNSVHSDRLEQLAFALYAQRSQPGRSVATLAVQCFQDAAAFLEVAGKIAAGELSADKASGLQLADVSAPNLKPTHPLNMISTRFHDREKFQRIYARLAQEPGLDQIEELNWGPAEVATARAIFPKYAELAN